MADIRIQLSSSLDRNSETSLDWALSRLESALLAAPGLTAGWTVSIGRIGEVADEPTVPAGRAPDERFAIWTAGTTTNLAGGGQRGLIYAITELADRVRLAPATALTPSAPIVESTQLPIRGVGRCVSNVATDRSWFLDEQFWLGYLDMLVDSRFNSFTLILGMQYNNPTHHNMMDDTYLCCPYPFFVDVPSYDVEVTELSAEERQRHLAMLQFIGRETGRRGLRFRLGLWTQFYEFDTVPNPNFHVTGLDAGNRNAYCAAALELLLRAVPEISGLTFRVHVEGGVADGDFDYWRAAFAGVAKAGRPIDVDLHAKGLDHEVLDIARDAGLGVTVSPKYIGEHMALPYHPASLRPRERQPGKSSTKGAHLTMGARRFLRYSYGDFLSANRYWNVVFRIWPGTQRILLWADPEMAAGYGRVAGLCGADGIEWCEPLSYYGRMGPVMPGSRQGYADPELATAIDWHKYAYQYRVWGRLTFCPDSAPEGWRRYLDAHCGDAAPHCAAALATASRVLPLVTQAHGVSVSNHQYWPEIYTNYSALGGDPKRPHGADMEAPFRFGNVPTFDPQLFRNPRELVTELLSGDVTPRYSPLQVADWLEQLAEETELELARIRSCSESHRPEARRIIVDSGIQAGLGRFFAQKFRSACWAELYLATAHRPALLEAISALRRALNAWEDVCAIAANRYLDDQPYGPQHFMRGSWSSRLAAIRAELADMISLRDDDSPKQEIATPDLAGIISELSHPRSVASGKLTVDFQRTFQRGAALPVKLRKAAAGAILHYRHINQGGAWQQTNFDATGAGEIPATYTDSAFHLQFYVTSNTADGTAISPGLGTTLSDQPYYVSVQSFDGMGMQATT